MHGRSEPAGSSGPAQPSHSESYVRLLVNLVGVVATLAGIAALMAQAAKTPTAPPPPSAAPPVSTVSSLSVVPDPAPEPPKAEPPAERPTTPTPAPPPQIDRKAVARAEAELDAATRDRARADARADDAAKRLADASTRAAAEAKAAKTLAFRVRDPSSRIAAAASQGGFLKAERDRIKGEVVALSRAPRPKAKVLSNQNPVAKPSDGDELHFEVRRNRVSYIDLDRLLDLVKADARLRIRLSDGARIVDSRVGPIGAFSLQYSLARSIPVGLEDMMERRGVSVSYNLRSWEVVPEFEGRGETYEAIQKPFSDFARVVNRVNPGRATITLWVYPDGFALYRKIRDDLHTRGYLVAARPLPEAMSIRGSPSGSLSAGQ
jgi:hypothetical protein